MFVDKKHGLQAGGFVFFSEGWEVEHKGTTTVEPPPFCLRGGPGEKDGEELVMELRHLEPENRVKKKMEVTSETLA